MKLIFIKTSIFILILALSVASAFFLGIWISDSITQLRLVHGWIRVGDPPVPVEEVMTPSMGMLFFKGEGGDVYSTCVSIADDRDCWKKVAYSVETEKETCPWLNEIPDPPKDTVASAINCQAFEYVVITGVAVTNTGHVYGYFGEASAMGALIQVFWVILLLIAVAIALAIVLSLRVFAILAGTKWLT